MKSNTEIGEFYLINEDGEWKYTITWRCYKNITLFGTYYKTLTVFYYKDTPIYEDYKLIYYINPNEIKQKLLSAINDIKKRVQLEQKREEEKQKYMSIYYSGTLR